MSEPKNHKSRDDNPLTNDQPLSPLPLESQQYHSPEHEYHGEDISHAKADGFIKRSWKNVCRIAKRRWVELKTAGADRLIELFLASAITISAFSQLLTTCSNNASTSEQTNQLIAAARINASSAQKNALAAGNFADSAQRINQGVNDAVGKLNLQAAEMAESAIQEERLAGSTETATHHSLQSDRAWIAIQNLNSISFPNGRLNFSFDLINSGKTPATNVHYAIGKLDDTHIVSDNLPPELNKNTIEQSVLNTSWDYKDVLILPPQGSFHVSFESPDSISPQTIWAITGGGRASFFVLGKVEYDTVLEKKQWETICFQIYRVNNTLETIPVFGWKYCAAGNGMSYDKEKYK